jgi:hypothetical protein
MGRVKVELGRLQRGQPVEAGFEFFEDRMQLSIRMELTSYGGMAKSSKGLTAAKDYDKKGPAEPQSL